MIGGIGVKRTSSFFFSKVMNKQVHNISGAVIGVLNDLIIDFDASRPSVKAIEIKNGNSLSYVSADSLEFHSSAKGAYQIILNTSKLSVLDTESSDIFLARDFLDKQIVDINGRKVVRVNDARLGYVRGKWQLVAVDIGLRGIIRRLGLENIIESACKLINVNFHNVLIAWDSVQPLGTGLENLRLATSMSKLKTLHAADIADIIEELDRKNREVVFRSLDTEKAAEVLEEVEADIQISLLEGLSDEKASDILEIMPSDEAADILEEIEDDRAERLLVQMEAENSEEIRELMEYKDLTVGSIMTKDLISFLPDVRISEAINALKQQKPKGDIGNSFFVVNNRGRLVGMVMPIDLLSSDGDHKLYDIMLTQTICLRDEDSIDDALELMQKYNLFSVPVVDEDGELIGMTSLNDLVYEYIRLRRVSA